MRALPTALAGAEAVSMGSSLQSCLIAEGQADLHLRDGPTMEWDPAAAQAVLEASGGRVFTLDGERLSDGKDGLRDPPFLALGDPRLEWAELLGASR